MKNLKIGDIWPKREIKNPNSDEINLDDYSFLNDDHKNEITKFLEAKNDEYGKAPSAYYEIHCIMLKKKLDTVQYHINKISDMSITEFAERYSYGNVINNIEELPFPVIDKSIIEKSKPKAYEVSHKEMYKVYKLARNITHVSLGVMIFVVLAFFLTVGDGFRDFCPSYKIAYSILLGIIVFSMLLMEHALQKIIRLMFKNT